MQVEASWPSVSQLSDQVRQGTTSAAEVVEIFQNKIQAYQGRSQPFTEVWVDSLKEQGRNLDTKHARGEKLGPLAGVPVALKDNLCVEGKSLRCSSEILNGFRSPYHATAVARLLAADALIVGHTRMDEFGMGTTGRNSPGGPVRNPRYPQLSTGGSSGGSAVAVAGGWVPLALGSDTGGSVRQPAAYCGVMGLCPSWGRVSRWGLVAFAPSLDRVGLLGRSTADLAQGFGVIAGPDGLDATVVEPPPVRPKSSLKELRLAWPQEVDSLVESLELKELWESWREIYENQGVRFVEVSLPLLKEALGIYHLIAAAEASSSLSRFDGIRYGRCRGGATVTDVYRETRTEGFGFEVRARLGLGAWALADESREEGYDRAEVLRLQLRESLTGILGKVDALALPTTPKRPPSYEQARKAEDTDADRFTTLASLTGHPALATPLGEANGAPFSLQLVGRRHEEEALLSLGGLLDQAWKERS